MATNYRMGARGRELHTDMGPFNRLISEMDRHRYSLADGHEAAINDPESMRITGEERREGRTEPLFTSTGTTQVNSDPVSGVYQRPIKAYIIRKLKAGTPLTPKERKMYHRWVTPLKQD